MDEPAGRYQGRQFGNYRLLSLIGEGGFSEVYLGEHVLLGTETAIKVMHTCLTDEEFERFRQEALTIIHMAHPNMVRVLDFGMQDHVPYLVMNYAPHGSVRQRYPSGTRLPLPVVVSLVKQVAAVLQYAHAKRVIHRDIKPDNLLIGRDEEILLSDFGIAVAAHNTYSMQTQEAIGTVAYMAPEQLRRKARPASDQYALGVMVYEWLSGELPFEGAPIEVALQHLTEPPPSLRKISPDLSPAVEQVVLKALAKDPQQRYPDEMVFAKALESASKVAVPEKPASSFPFEQMSTGREAPHYGRRNDSSPRGRVALLVSLALIIMLGAGGIGLFALSHHQVLTNVKVSVSTITPGAPLPGSANWSMYGFDAQHSQFNSSEKTISLNNVATLTSAWETRIRGYVGYTPTIVNNVLYIAGGGSTLYAINARTGSVIWQTKPQLLQNANHLYSPTVVNGMVYFASDNGTLAAFDARTSKLLWSFSSQSVANSFAQDSPTYSNGIIYFGSHSGSVYALDARTGKTIWSTFTGGYTGVAVANGVVYAASNTQLFALNASTGATLWVGTIGTQKTVEVEPVVGNSIVMVTTDDGIVLAFVANGCGKFVCAPHWLANTLQKVGASPAIAYGVVYLSTFYRNFDGGTLIALDASTGKFLWVAQTQLLYSAPVVANGVVYVINTYGTAYAFNAHGCGHSTCPSLWQVDSFDSYDSVYSITISDGQIYICTPMGYIRAFHAS